jgi:glutamate 5-kinase
MRMKQAAAAVGQCQNMFLYDKFFGEYGHTIAQILLNASDIEQEEKKENLTNTFNALLENGIIPIVNENDSVNYTEIESKDLLFGDNDMLSSVVAVLVQAKRLVILSDIDGFYEADPRFHPKAKLIERIEEIDDSLYCLAGGAGSRRGTGGMRTKLQAAELATSQGTATLVTNGARPEALYDVVDGKKVGTLFVAKR